MQNSLEEGLKLKSVKEQVPIWSEYFVGKRRTLKVHGSNDQIVMAYDASRAELQPKPTWKIDGLANVIIDKKLSIYFDEFPPTLEKSFTLPDNQSIQSAFLHYALVGLGFNKAIDLPSSIHFTEQDSHQISDLMPVKISAKDKVWHVWLSTSENLQLVNEDWSFLVSNPRNLDQISTDVSAIIGQTKLPIWQVQKLVIGDIILIETIYFRQESISVRVYAGENLVPIGVCAIDASNLIFIDTKNVIMVNKTEQAIDDARGVNPQQIQSIELDVSFEVAKIKMNVGELSRIEPGYVIALDQSVEQSTVRVLANGHAIAQGQLISIGDKLGVRISRFATDKES